MTRWYDALYNYVGYSAYFNGAIHYYTETAAGVITDQGTSKPASFITTHCAPASTAVKVRTAGVLPGATFTNFNFGVNNPALFTNSFTNSFSVPILFTLHFVSARGIAAPAGEQYLDQITSITSNVAAISYAFNPLTQYHRFDFNHNQSVPRTYQKYDQASTHIIPINAGQTVTFTGGYAFSGNTIPTVAYNYIEFKLNYEIIEA